MTKVWKRNSCSSQNTPFRDKLVVHQQGVSTILYRVRDQECLFITSVSPIKWACRGYEQNTARVLEKTLNHSKRKMGRRVTTSPLGLPNNSKATNRGDTIRLILWHRASDTDQIWARPTLLQQPNRNPIGSRGA